MERFDILIAGAGVTGGMIARELSRYQLSVCLLDKANDVATGDMNEGVGNHGFIVILIIPVLLILLYLRRKKDRTGC